MRMQEGLTFGSVSLEEAGSSPLFPTIDIDGVSKTYRAVDGRSIRAVDTVSAFINQGEFISILGPSGCGKSTLLMMIAGLLSASEGVIRYEGKDIVGPRPEFGMVFQDATLFPWRNIIENVSLPAEVRKIPKSSQLERASSLIKLVGLEGFETKYPRELSGGMQQRVAIARALMLAPKLILMDEPFGALDAMTREQMNLELQRIRHATGATVIFVTHSISEAAFLSDRVFVMSGRPSTVREIIEIDLPSPRPIEVMTSGKLDPYITRLRNLLNA